MSHKGATMGLLEQNCLAIRLDGSWIRSQEILKSTENWLHIIILYFLDKVLGPEMCFEFLLVFGFPFSV